MFATVRRHFTDARTLSALCTAAEAAARARGIAEPGSEHFVLAALALPDQTASAAFSRLALTSLAFKDAIDAQYGSALDAVGIVAPSGEVSGDRSESPCRPVSPLYKAAPSGQVLMQRLAERRHERKSRSLVSADILLAVADEQFTVAARAMQALGVQREALVNAARASITEVAERGEA